MKKEVKLKLVDRLTLPAILKKEANYETLIINSDIKKKVEITQQDLIDYQIKTVGEGQVSWSKEANEVEFVYTFSEMEVSKIKEALIELNNSNKLTEDVLGLYKQFVM